MKQIKGLFVILVLSLVVIIIVQNFQALTTPVSFKIDLLFYNFQSSNIPLSLIALAAFFFGLVAAGLQGIFERMSLKRDIRFLKKELEMKEKEVSSLRNLPVTAGDDVPVNLDAK
jgi:uncharacterized integral membrane protein